MSTRVVRLAAAASAAAIIGLTGMAAGTASAAPAPTAATTAVAPADYQFIDWYPNRQQCSGGGEYFLRHGYSSYICQLDPMRGWALFVR